MRPAPPGVARVRGRREEFLLRDRLPRVFQPAVRIALGSASRLIDSDRVVALGPDAPGIAVFARESDSMTWLMA